jgi:hypothetical protein
MTARKTACACRLSAQLARPRRHEQLYVCARDVTIDVDEAGGAANGRSQFT